MNISHGSYKSNLVYKRPIQEMTLTQKCLCKTYSYLNHIRMKRIWAQSDIQSQVISTINKPGHHTIVIVEVRM